MNAKLSHIRLLVEDFPRSFAFYRDIVGLAPRFGDEQSGYGEFSTGETTLALFSRGSMLKALGTQSTAPIEGHDDRAVLVLFVDDVDAAHASLQSRGVPFVTAPTNRPEWTIRTAHFRDPDGNLIELAGRLKA